MVFELNEVHRLTIPQLEFNIRPHMNISISSGAAGNGLEFGSEFRPYTPLPETVAETETTNNSSVMTRSKNRTYLAEAMVDVLHKAHSSLSVDSGEDEDEDEGHDAKQQALAQLLRQILILRRANLKVLEVLGWFDDESEGDRGMRNADLLTVPHAVRC